MDKNNKNTETEKSGFSEKMTVFCFFAVMAFLFLGFVFLPKKDFSENENRGLAKFPEFSLGTLASGEFTDKMSDYCSDHFPLRDTLVFIKSGSEIALLKGESGGVLLGSGGYIIKDAERVNEESIKENFSHIDALAKKLSVPTVVALAPRSIDMLKDYLPADYPTEKAEAFERAIRENSLSDNFTFADLYEALYLHTGEDIYYKTDHHFTTLGAYYAYCEIMKSLGEEPYPLDSFTSETASESFFGTTWSFGGIPFVSPDKIEFMRFDGDESFEVSVLGKQTQKGLYDRDFLEKKDKYSAFITSTTNGYITVKGEGEGRQTLVLIKDSFSHTLAPFLARHFDLVMIDTRYYTPKKGEVTSFVTNDENSVKAVVVLMGASGMNDTSYDLYKLRNA